MVQPVSSATDTALAPPTDRSRPTTTTSATQTSSLGGNSVLEALRAKSADIERLTATGEPRGLTAGSRRHRKLVSKLNADAPTLQDLQLMKTHGLLSEEAMAGVLKLQALSASGEAGDAAAEGYHAFQANRFQAATSPDERKKLLDEMAAVLDAPELPLHRQAGILRKLVELDGKHLSAWKVQGKLGGLVELLDDSALSAGHRADIIRTVAALDASHLTPERLRSELDVLTASLEDPESPEDFRSFILQTLLSLDAARFPAEKLSAEADRQLISLRAAKSASQRKSALRGALLLRDTLSAAGIGHAGLQKALAAQSSEELRRTLTPETPMSWHRVSAGAPGAIVSFIVNNFILTGGLASSAIAVTYRIHPTASMIGYGLPIGTTAYLMRNAVNRNDNVAQAIVNPLPDRDGNDRKTEVALSLQQLIGPMDKPGTRRACALLLLLLAAAPESIGKHIANVCGHPDHAVALESARWLAEDKRISDITRGGLSIFDPEIKKLHDLLDNRQLKTEELLETSKTGADAKPLESIQTNEQRNEIRGKLDGREPVDNAYLYMKVSKNLLSSGTKTDAQILSAGLMSLRQSSPSLSAQLTAHDQHELDELIRQARTELQDEASLQGQAAEAN